MRSLSQQPELMTMHGEHPVSPLQRGGHTLREAPPSPEPDQPFCFQGPVHASPEGSEGRRLCSAPTVTASWVAPRTRHARQLEALKQRLARQAGGGVSAVRSRREGWPSGGKSQRPLSYALYLGLQKSLLGGRAQLPKNKI